MWMWMWMMVVVVNVECLWAQSREAFQNFLGT